MRKPSIFNNDYHRIVRRRKIIYRTLIMLFALTVIFFTYNKSAVPNLKKFAEKLKYSSKSDVSQPQSNISENPIDNEKTGEDSKKTQENQEEQAKQEQVNKTQGEIIFKFPTNESIAIVFEEKDNDRKIIGIKPDNTGISYDIRDDGKAIAFDNPRSSDMWIFNIDGSSRVLNPQSYITVEGNKEFKKADIMERFNNNYIWAARPKFLKDGSVVYQSNLPWFLEVNTIYLWVVNSDGTGNKMIIPTRQANPVKYSGFTSDGKLIVEFGGSKYALSIEKKTKQRID